MSERATAIQPPWGPTKEAPWNRLSLNARVVGLLGGAIFIMLALLALAPWLLAPYNPYELVGRPLQPPDSRFYLGTNDIGQDLLSELIWGTRISLSTGMVVALLAVTIGTLVGVVSAAVGGPVSAVLMRSADLVLVLPLLPLIILLSAYLGPDQRNVIGVLTLVFWAGPARLVRSRAVSILKEPYMEASRALGSSLPRLIWAHVWPGVRAIALLQFILVASASILAEASLSFLGLGDTAAKSWGGMLYFARASGAFLGDAWLWWVLPTGLMITLTILSLVFIGYALEGRLEPLSRG